MRSTQKLSQRHPQPNCCTALAHSATVKLPTVTHQFDIVVLVLAIHQKSFPFRFQNGESDSVLPLSTKIPNHLDFCESNGNVFAPPSSGLLPSTGIMLNFLFPTGY